MADVCKNCSEPITHNFCAHCGQKKFKRIDANYVKDEMQYSVLHMNKGFFYSVRKLIANPGKTAREYIDGNRVNHYKPILLTFVLAGIATFISFKGLGLSSILQRYYAEQNLNSDFSNDVVTVLQGFNSFIMLGMVPIFALATWLAFKKFGHNYFEHMVLNAYFMAYYTLVNIIFIYPILFFVRNVPSTFVTISQTTTLIAPALLFWFLMGFYPEKRLSSIAVNLAATFALLILVFLILMTLFGVGAFLYAMVSGPESLEYIRGNSNQPL